MLCDCVSSSHVQGAWTEGGSAAVQSLAMAKVHVQCLCVSLHR